MSNSPSSSSSSCLSLNNSNLSSPRSSLSSNDSSPHQNAVNTPFETKQNEFMINDTTMNNNFGTNVEEDIFITPKTRKLNRRKIPKTSNNDNLSIVVTIPHKFTPKAHVNTSINSVPSHDLKLKFIKYLTEKKIINIPNLNSSSILFAAQKTASFPFQYKINISIPSSLSSTYSSLINSMNNTNILHDITDNVSFGDYLIGPIHPSITEAQLQTTLQLKVNPLDNQT